MDGQTLAVLAIVILAAGYLVLRGMKLLRRSKTAGNSCGSGDCGCGH